ncbi:MAG: ParB/RepB/Spo0J family partition protein [Pseudomonadota bacterium]
MGRLGNKLAGKTTGLDMGPGGAPISINGPGAGRFLEIDPAAIEANPHQPRRQFNQDALQTLADSIKEHGLLEPLVVRLEEGRVVLVAGERRLRAARLAGLSRVPCTVSEGDPAILALIENLHRQDLTPLEEAEAYRRLQQQKGFGLAELAQLAGKAVSTVSEILSLAKLPEPVKAAAAADPARFPQRLLVELAKVEPQRAQELALEASNGGLNAETVRQHRQGRQANPADPQFRRAETNPPAPASPTPGRNREGASEVARVDGLFRRAEMLAGELLGVNLHGLNPRQRALARHSLQPLARALDRHFHFLKKAAREDAKRWSPERRARLLDLVRSEGMHQARAVMGAEIYEDGQPLHPSEAAEQLSLARQEARTSAEDLGSPGDC